jgi:ubiquinone/menaquinone biosynthesis C-methylase UbiE
LFSRAASSAIGVASRGVRAKRTSLAVALGLVAVGYWSRTHPSACPYSLRFILRFPRRALARERLLEVLGPQPGERVLELGPGTGYYSLDVAATLDGGRLDIFDISQDFLDDVQRRATSRGIDNITAMQGDARVLRYASEEFDAALLVTVLGEIPDQDAALRELARVLRPGGRLVVGESLAAGDPHAVTFGNLCRRAEAAGLKLERRLGSPLAYFARFRKPL